MKIKSFVLTSLIALATVQARSQGTFVYDQQSSTESVVDEAFLNIQINQPIGQSFTPSLSTVGFVRLDLTTGPTQGGASLDVLLHSGSITGPTIGTSELVSLPVNFTGFVNFVFDAPPSVTPGTQYYFQPVIGSGSDVVSANFSDLYGYAGGVGIIQGANGGEADMWFREGIIVPEPSTWVLVFLGASAFLWFRRR